MLFFNLNAINNEISFVRNAPYRSWHAAMPKNVNTYCHNSCTWLFTLLFNINNPHNLDPGLQELAASNIAIKILLPEDDKDTAITHRRELEEGASSHYYK